jgi:hypothetical protein
LKAHSPETDFYQVRICKNPIFIVGSPRSGTTVLALALARHSRLWYSSESHIFPHLFGGARWEETDALGPNVMTWMRRKGVSREELLQSAALGVNALFTSRSGNKRWIEKTPQNTPMVGTLSAMFPGASFLHLLRDGRAVVNSMIHMDAPALWTRHFALACWAWRRSVELALEFEARHPDRCLTVRHEALSADPETVCEQIFQFLAVPAESGPVEYLRSHRLNSSFESGRTMPDPWSGWTSEQKGTFLKEARDLLRRRGLIDPGELEEMERDVRVS